MNWKRTVLSPIEGTLYRLAAWQASNQSDEYSYRYGDGAIYVDPLDEDEKELVRGQAAAETGARTWLVAAVLYSTLIPIFTANGSALWTAGIVLVLVSSIVLYASYGGLETAEIRGFGEAEP